MSFTTDEIHDLMDRLTQALERRQWALGPYGEPDEMAAELDAVTSALSDGERETVGRYLEALVRAEAPD